MNIETAQTTSETLCSIPLYLNTSLEITVYNILLLHGVQDIKIRLFTTGLDVILYTIA